MVNLLGNFNRLAEEPASMRPSHDFKTLSFEGTVKVGLSFLGVVIIIVTVSSVLLMFGSEFQSEQLECLNGDVLKETDISDGFLDCPSGEDENSEYRVTQKHNIISLTFTGLGGILFAAGFLGLFTKMIADAISAGLFLHLQTENASLPNQTKKTPSTLEKRELQCPSCESKLAVETTSLGRPIRCPKCKTTFNLGSDSAKMIEAMNNEHPFEEQAQSDAEEEKNTENVEETN